MLCPIWVKGQILNQRLSTCMYHRVKTPYQNHQSLKFHLLRQYWKKYKPHVINGASTVNETTFLEISLSFWQKVELTWFKNILLIVLFWVALLITRLLHFINGDRPARRVPLFARRCRLGCLGSKIFEFDNGHSNVLIFTYLPSSLRKLFLKTTTFLFKLV